MTKNGQPESRRSIVVTHWNAGVFRPAALPQLLPELAVYSLLYDEVLIREEDLITNRHILRMLSVPDNFEPFRDLLVSGLVKILRLPIEEYPTGRQFNPVRLPISARAEEHELRRSYKGKPWRPTKWEWKLFAELDDIVAKHPPASRFHEPFESENVFAAQMAEILENRDSYQLKKHPVFGYLDETTADHFIRFCREPEEWQRFLHDRGVHNFFGGPDPEFYRSSVYQCSRFLPTPRAIRRLAESVYAATYCGRESSDGRYGGSELVELPYRFPSDEDFRQTLEDAVRIEVIPTGASATIRLGPGIAAVLERTRESTEFLAIRRTLDALGSNPESTLLTEQRFAEAWRDLSAVYAENSAILLQSESRMEHRVSTFGVYAYILTRVLGVLVLPKSHLPLNVEVAADAAAIATIEKLGPKMMHAVRGLLGVPAIRGQLESAVSIRCSTVPLSLDRD